MERYKKYYTQKFRKVWLSYADLRDWLEEVKEDKTKAKCKFCQVLIIARLYSIRKHAECRYHQQKYENFMVNPALVFTDEFGINENLIPKNTGWRNVCLVCLRKNRRIIKNIFEKDDDDIMISDKISECSVFKELEKNVNIPHNICIECYNDLLTAYKFRKFCEKSYNALQKFIKKQNTISETVEEYVQDLPGSENEHENDEMIEKILKLEQLSDIDMENKTTVENITFEIQNATEIKQEEIEEDDIDIQNVNNNDDDDDDDDGDNDDDIVGIYLNQEDFYLKSENEDDIKQEDQNQEIEILEEFCPDYYVHKNNGKNYQHIREKAILICEICGNSYEDSYSLKFHMRRHLNDKRYQCEICSKRFYLNQELVRHIRTHTGEKPYLCKYCKKKFSDYSSKIRHERIHTGERPYKCEVCGKAFMYNHVLKNHEKKHLGYNLSK